MQEIWKDIKGYEGLYQVSNLGRVKRLSTTLIRKDGRYVHFKEHFVVCNIAKMGYYMLDLHRYGSKRKRVYLHRVIAEAFIPNPDNLPCINHKDENKLNNNVDNLEWCTYAYNLTYGSNRKKSVETRRKNGTYDNISQEARNNISKSLLGKKKSPEHCKHISEGRKRMLAERRKRCNADA